MDTNMEDVGRVPAELTSAALPEPATVPTVDGWIENLMKCKQLAEADVQRLCEKVRCPSSKDAIILFAFRFLSPLPFSRAPGPDRPIDPTDQPTVAHLSTFATETVRADLSFVLLGTRGSARRIQRTTSGTLIPSSPSAVMAIDCLR
ncbi:hypothetical protein B0T17DRAFT_194265 [Bombardia bombarda]|uniref:Uncharacterized protein n=1 Tax=Bombardia bombarda TaxID=252184 RepID=A0AA39X9A0_9PEZI|nr:hypothetical protein B0T17DRAFT_194265 [Bombardia bombarda]